jgi:hypothetical protein
MTKRFSLKNFLLNSLGRRSSLLVIITIIWSRSSSGENLTTTHAPVWTFDFVSLGMSSSSSADLSTCRLRALSAGRVVTVSS